MALVRILVDGSSLLQSWPELAPGKPRHSAAAKWEIVTQLTRYYDACGTPLTVVFDAPTLADQDESPDSTAEVEVLYTPPGQKREQVLKRAAHRFRACGQVLIVTGQTHDPGNEAANGHLVSDCGSFVRTVQTALRDLENAISSINRKENDRFNQGR